MNLLLVASAGLATGLAIGLTTQTHHEQEEPVPTLPDLPEITDIIRTELTKLLPHQPEQPRHNRIWIAITALTLLITASWVISRVPTAPHEPNTK